MGRLLEFWERAERDDWRMIMPTEGGRAFDSTLINPTTVFILDALRNKQSVTEIVNDLQAKHPDAPYDRLWDDVRGCLMYLRELGVYTMDQEETVQIYATGAASLPGLHILEETEIPAVSEQLTKWCQPGSPAALYSLEQLAQGGYAPQVIRSLHFYSMQYMFVHNGADGKMDGVVTLMSPSPMKTVQTIGFIAAFSDNASRRKSITEEMLRELEMHVDPLLAPVKLRLLGKVYHSDVVDPGVNREPWSEELVPVLAECGYRIEATLENEGGSGIDLLMYGKVMDKNLA